MRGRFSVDFLWKWTDLSPLCPVVYAEKHGEKVVEVVDAFIARNMD